MFYKSTALGNALINTYAKCGALAKAEELFYQLPVRNTVTWNTLIGAYTQHGSAYDALSYFERMQEQGFTPNAVTYISVLKACGMVKDIQKGEEIHVEIGRQGLLPKDAVLGTSLIYMYAKCGAVFKAKTVFDTLPSRNVVTWNVIMNAYADHGLNDEAFSCFQQMQYEDLLPTVATFKCMLKVCSNLKSLEKGEAIHKMIERYRLLETDSSLNTALIDMYVKCRALENANAVFDKLPRKCTSTWTVLLQGYAENGFGNKALNIFHLMQTKNISPDAVTYVCVLRACGSIRALHQGEEIHMEINRTGLLENNDVLVTAVIDMYCECGALSKAQEVLDRRQACVAAWNALISGYVKHGDADKALGLFGKMIEEGIIPNAITYNCALKACGIIGAAEVGKNIHSEIHKKQLLENDSLLLAALLDMYMNCGVHAAAQKVIAGNPKLNVTLYSVLMAGCAQVGKASRVFDMVNDMVTEGLQPNPIIFTIILGACSHTGLVNDSETWFETMSTVYHISPTQEHWICMVDIFSRAGLFEKVISMIGMVPPANSLPLWLCLMGACQQWVNVDVGRLAFDHILQFDKKLETAYICMRNVYMAAGMQKEAAQVENLRVKNGAWKDSENVMWTGCNGYSFLQ
ncbi:hypothetical protein KP509_22G078800 [Ceratopteris richardii]|nr:hypothetical protein KP509_22G078800 [Ceratopteris richardii]